MRDYSISGEFGDVKLFDVCPASGAFSSVDRVTSAGWHRVNELYRIHRPRGVSSGLLLFTLGGRGQIRVDKTELVTESGRVVILPPDVPHEYAALPGEDWEFYWVHFRGPYSELCTKDLLSIGAYEIPMETKWMELTLGDYRHFASVGMERELESAAWLRRVLHRLLGQAVAARYTPDEQGTARRIMRFLEQDPHPQFSLDLLTSEFHYSKEYLIRLFKKATGMTPYRYWLLLRLKRACFALEQGQKSVEEIALECGYGEISSFSKQFKKCYGISPTEYRRLHGFCQN
ncbi:MAG: helix-turn-helix domain-containing protein [Clostridia bacterium]|nr:helix-turn-helix domain-containing protein [Clostridia bacterium]